MSILIFFVVLFVLILVHELGHFIVAKKTGMRVDEFGIGFPPKLFGITRGETEYSLNALPIGGFVRIFGEDGTNETSGQSEGRAFSHKSKWAQAAVLIAGVTMNVIFAWVLLVAVLMMGVPTAVDEATASNESKLIITEVLTESPADTAKIPAGAEIVSLHSDGETVESLTPSAFTAFTTEHADDEMTLTYRAGGEEIAVQLSPETGIISSNESQPAIGVALSLVDTVRYPIHTAIYEATVVTVTALGAITVGITNLLVDAFTLDADLSQVAGPVGIVGLVGDAAEFGFASLLMFTAIISLNLAVINMLPFPALDGGRLLFVAYEAITRRQINPVWAGRANMVGFALLILLMVAVTYNDILRIL
ncbi:MAG: site-2 protease family protein [Candidatus Paceibacterota bacterium]